MDDLTKKTNVSIDVVKYLMAIIVVSIHLGFMQNSAFVKAIWSLAVPFFAVVSGYYGVIQTKDKLLRGGGRMIALILVADVMLYPEMIYWQKLSNTVCFNARYFFLDFIKLGHLWYLLALIMSYGISYILRNHLKSKILIYLTFGLHILYYGFMTINVYIVNSISIFISKNISSYGANWVELFLKIIIAFMPYYFAGIFIRIFSFESKIKKIPIYYMVPVLIFYMIERRFLHHVFGTSSYYCSILVISLFVIFLLQRPYFFSSSIELSRYFRFTSIFMYLVHPAFIFIFRQFIKVDDTTTLIYIVVTISLLSFIVMAVINSFRERKQFV